MADGFIRAGDKMTSRQRLLAAYRGQPVDRLPYWAKVTNENWRAAQPDSIQKMSDVELLDYIHADGLFGTWIERRFVQPHVTSTTRQIPNGRVTTISTPDGDLVERWAYDPQTITWHPIEFLIKSREDIARYRWVLADNRIEFDEKMRQDTVNWEKELGERGIFTAWWGESPLMYLVEHIIGPVNTTYLLMDYPDEMDELINLMQQHSLMCVEHMAKNWPADVIISGENTSTTLISPQQFERYSYKHLCEYGKIIESCGKMHELHMCGHTKALLPLIDTIPANSIEAFTSPTLGNTRLVDGKTLAPGKTLIGGTNAMLWLKPVDQIKAYIEAELAACPDHRRIVLTTAGVAPQFCTAETFRQIGQWATDLPVRI